MSDGELLLLARDGDSDAWHALVDRLGNRVFAVARAHGLGRADAEDVSQIAWYRLLTHINEIRDPERVGAWLATTARNESLRVLKRHGRQIPSDDEEAFEQADERSPSPDARLLADERQLAVWEALARLPPHCQRLLRLFMVDPPPSYEEVTAALDMPIGSVGPTRQRCLAKLKDRLDGISGSGEGSGP
ncbi:MAG: RNA polymerase sigma factor [Acidimicrobiales bacterium]